MGSRFALASLALTAALFSNAASAGPVPTLPPTSSWTLSDLTTGGTSPWSFGTTGTSLTGTFTAFTQLNTSWDGLYSYLSPAGEVGYGVGYSGPSDYVGGGVTIPGGMLAFQPGADNEFAVVRFTAPYAGRFMVNGVFMGADTTPTNSEAYIVSGGDVLFHETIEGFSWQSYRGGSPTVILAAGQTVDFLVGQGADGAWNDATAFTAWVDGFAQPVPEPSAYAMFAAGLLAVGAVARRRRGGSAV